MSEIFASWSTDHALLVHGYLLGFAVFSTAVVAAGIIWENGPPEVAEIATRLVIWGVAAEAICTVALFVFDEGISSSQQSKIIALETRLAPRKIENPAALTEKLKPFSGTPYDFSLEVEPEPLALMDKLAAVLDAAGWQRQGCEGQGVIFNEPGRPPACLIGLSGIAIHIDNSRTADWEPAVLALLNGLKAEGIEADALRITDNSETPKAVHIKIGTKP